MGSKLTSSDKEEKEKEEAALTEKNKSIKRKKEPSENLENDRSFQNRTSENLDEDHVTMPFFNQQKWADINNSLKLLKLKLRDDNSSLYFIEEAIIAYNKNFKNSSSFMVLKRYFDELNSEEATIIRKTIMQMIELVFQTPILMRKPIPYLKRGEKKSIVLTQKQCATLLANAFFCTFPHRINSKNQFLSNFNFNKY